MMRIFRAVSAKVSLVRSIPQVRRINLLRQQSVNYQVNHYRFNSDIGSRSYVHPLVSYSQGLSSHPCVIDTIPILLNQRVDENGDKVCLVSHSEGIKKTFKELRDDANKLAGALHHELGLGKGDTIGIWSLNSAIWVTTKLAADILGTVQATINPYYKIEELAYAIKQSKMKVLFMPGPGSVFQNFNNFDGILNDPALASMIKDSCLTDIIFLDGTKATDSIGKLRVHHIQDLFSMDYRSPPEILQDPDDPNILMYTSGTTGKPKGALVSQYSIINNCYFVSKRQTEIANQAVVCCPLPLFHSFALVHGLVSFIVNDGTLVLSGNRFDPRSVIESITQNKCDLLICTPTMAIDLLRLAERRGIKLDSLTSCVLGGALADVQIIKRLRSTFPSLKTLLNGYGTTELSPCATIAGSEDSEENILQTNGRALDHLECKIVDPWKHNIVKHNEKGELWVRGWAVMLEYFNDETKTKEAITPARWYKTGDIAVMNSEGFITIVGRIKELIIRGGENIYPKEIENCIMEHPSVAEAYAFGIPDDRLGEEICAWIKLKEDAPEMSSDEMKNYVKEKITYFKVPKHIYFVKEFPLLNSLKASKLMMKDITLKEFLKKA